jgi:hypothetical protein
LYCIHNQKYIPLLLHRETTKQLIHDSIKAGRLALSEISQVSKEGWQECEFLYSRKKASGVDIVIQKRKTARSNGGSFCSRHELRDKRKGKQQRKESGCNSTIKNTVRFLSQP